MLTKVFMNCKVSLELCVSIKILVMVSIRCRMCTSKFCSTRNQINCWKGQFFGRNWPTTPLKFRNKHGSAITENPYWLWNPNQIGYVERVEKSDQLCNCKIVVRSLFGMQFQNGRYQSTIFKGISTTMNPTDIKYIFQNPQNRRYSNTYSSNRY